MQNWFDIITPHEDIRKGHFDEAVFAAKLGDVTSGEAPPDYNDPYAFYKKTYITSGLENLLQRVSEKLSGGKGPGVVQLQTPFGGGKTHALILTYHYLTSGERVEGLLPDGVEQQSPHLATIVGTDANASEGFETDGVQRHTLWGELAYQLGGEDALGKIEANDQNRTSPGRKSLRDVLEPLQPFCILLDEALEYVVRARGVEVGDTTLGAQTLSFFQELTEAVSSLPRGLMIATLPSGENEDFSDDKARNLGKIQQIFGRLEAIYTPVQGEEVYSIIRRRLFEAPDDQDDVREIIDQYVRRYGQHKDELPAKVREGDYRRKMERAYPFHPEVIDILYEKWGTFASFQRTRGALRLLAHVVADLYERESNIDLILPGDVSLERPAIRREFLRHIGETYEGVIGSDIAGSSAKSQVLDRANREWKHLAERNATGVFLHSFSADSTQRGITLPHIKLGVLRSGTIPSLVFEVLSKQAGELWYLNQKGDRYYFSDVPNLNRMVIDKKGMVQPRAVRDELETLLKREFGSKLRCYLWPSASDEIPDNRNLKLAVIDPENQPSDRQLKQWVERRNGGFRAYQNTLFFALPDRDRFSRVAEELKEFLALQEIEGEIENDDRSGMKQKRNEVKRRLKKLREDFPLRMRELYRTAAVPGAEGDLEMIDLGQPAVGRENLDSWYYTELADQTRGKILKRAPSARLLQAKFLASSDAVPLSAVQEQFYKDSGLPALADTELLAEAVSDGVRSGSFGIAREEDGEFDPSSLRFEENIGATTIPFEEGAMLITGERAHALREKQKSSVQPGPGQGQTPTTASPPDAEGEEEKPETEGLEDDGQTEIGTTATTDEETVERFHIRASGLSPAHLIDLSRGVFSPLSQEVGDLTFTIEVDVSSEDGLSKKMIEQQVMETLQQLGATVERREEE
jgi:predicted AAA+ superfamily ATPase